MKLLDIIIKKVDIIIKKLDIIIKKLDIKFTEFKKLYFNFFLILL